MKTLLLLLSFETTCIPQVCIYPEMIDEQIVYSQLEETSLKKAARKIRKQALTKAAKKSSKHPRSPRPLPKCYSINPKEDTRCV